MADYTVATTGTCTDIFQATGGSGKNPPAICGTNTGYHSEIIVFIYLSTFFLTILQVYVEFGASATDSVTLTHTYGDTTTKSWNILARQIACTAAWKYDLQINYILFLISSNIFRAPTDCVQYYTGVSGNVQNYNFGNQILASQDYSKGVVALSKRFFAKHHKFFSLV